ncbi:AAA family ATPase [Actinoalloteichus spitiensis]|uniref:AAA family ATPase n=1 Tax=Actinoalloteichus spitiensis TaxID=252394 RepID=UPI001469A021|nr:LuxR family transcriptional regulator [Actinoalloteichus spitiensis]
MIGRRRHLQVLTGLMDTTGNIGSLLLLRGDTGAGKTSLVGTARRVWTRQGARVLTVDTDQPSQPLTLDLVIESLRDQLDHVTDPEFAERVAVAAQMRDRLRHSTEPQLLALVHTISVALSRLVAIQRTVLVIDDADRVSSITRPAFALLLQNARAAGCAVVVTTGFRRAGCSFLHQLVDTADDVLDVEPLDGEDAHQLLARALPVDNAAIDPGLEGALRAALGGLYGNPGTVLTTVRSLAEQGRLRVIDEHLCLVRPEETIRLDEDHELTARVRAAGPDAESLAATAATVPGLRVDDLPVISEVIGADLDSAGHALDRLVGDGVLRLDAAGRLAFPVPALAATLRSRGGPEAARDRHRSFAEVLRRRSRRGVAVDRARLADHVAAAGPVLPWPDAADLLVTEADSRRNSQPLSAMTWYAAALERLTATDPRWWHVFRWVTRLQFGLGRYQELSATTRAAVPMLRALAGPDTGRGDRVAAPGPADDLFDISIRWLFAAMQQQRAHEVDEVLGLLEEVWGDTSWGPRIAKSCALMLRGRLHAAVAVERRALRTSGELAGDHGTGELVVTGLEAMALTTALAGDRRSYEWAWSRLREDRAADGQDVPTRDQLRDAALLVDYATAFGLVLGDRYAPPVDGPLPGYQLLIAHYHSGDWDRALSLARSLEAAADGEDTPPLHLVRVFAAEMCSERGEFDRAWAWLERIPATTVCGHYLAWVRCGLLHRTGDVVAADVIGWQNYHRHRQAGYLALAPLLTRLTDQASRQGDEDGARRGLAELERLDDEVGSPGTRQSVLLMRGLVEGDVAALDEGLRMARARGDQPSVARALLIKAGVAPDQRQWLREFHQVCERLHGDGGRGHLIELMRGMGLSPVRVRTRRPDFSDLELRIIDLVSDGRTNRQIAVTVGVSEKTVESRLTRLFSRTGCRSRTELAAARIEGRLSGGSDPRTDHPSTPRLGEAVPT